VPIPLGDIASYPYPNPCTHCGETNIKVWIASRSDVVRIQLFTTAYRKINEFVLTGLSVGFTPVKVPLRDKKGKMLADGVYYLRVITPQGSVIRKLLVLR
jgi:hypothetical protein